MRYIPYTRIFLLVILYLTQELEYFYERFRITTVSQAYFALHETLHQVQFFFGINIFWY